MSELKKKILYVQPNSEVGGSDIALLRLICSLDKNLYIPVVVMPAEGPLAGMLRNSEAEVKVIPMVQLRTTLSPSHQLRYLINFLPTILKIKRFILDNRVDLVHTNSLYCLYGAWAAKLANCPHIWHIREIPPQVPIAKDIYAMMVKLLSKKVVVMTRAVAYSLFSKPDNIKNISYLTEGMDLTKWLPDIKGDRIRRELGISDNSKLVGFVGRLDPWKGLDVFLRAAALVIQQFPDTHFIISGDAPGGFENYRDEMKNLARQLGLSNQVEFLGWKYRLDDIPEVMAALDVFCHTSTDPEPFGLVVIEAMSMGKAVIAAKAGGPLEIIEDRVSGCLTLPGKHDLLATAICEILGDEVFRRSLGIAARKRVETKFSLKSFTKQIAGLYASIFGHDNITL